MVNSDKVKNAKKCRIYKGFRDMTSNDKEL